MVAKNRRMGKTVLITRPRAQAAELAKRLRQKGIRVIAAPAIRIVDPSSWSGLDRALRRIRSYDTLIFTSVNGVTRFFDRAKALRLAPQRPGRLYAIGPQTAKALRRHGWRGIGIPDTYEGAALARKLGHVRGQRVLIPRAKKARDVLPKYLKARGASVDVVEAYQTVGDTAGIARIRRMVRENTADIVTFTSSSTVEHFMKAVPKAQGLRFFNRAAAASIGPITSSTLRRFNIRNIIEAKTYTSAGLVQSIIRALQNGKH